jgi:D-beta-D-heptose 7-phosphate kinase/D-beta-D-heptose 1-phosphate adenosyltransferase
VDPKGHQWEKYRGATVVTPNVKELSEIAARPIKNEDNEIAAHAREVRSRYGFCALLVTRSEKGMTLVDGNGVEHFPTEAREVFDVSGAGDTVVASLAACLAGGYPLREAVTIANKAAGVVVGKIGTVPIELGELRAALDKDHNPKLLDARALLRRCAEERQRGRTIVFANGCFDILHRGHVHLLEEAKKRGDILVVALNSDRSAKAIRGASFPINAESDRAHLMAAVSAVDFVTVFNEKTPVGLIRQIRPDVIVKGGNYRKNQVVGMEYAGKTVIIPNLAGYSTREITRKICGR